MGGRLDMATLLFLRNVVVWVLGILLLLKWILLVGLYGLTISLSSVLADGCPTYYICIFLVCILLFPASIDGQPDMGHSFVAECQDANTGTSAIGVVQRLESLCDGRGRQNMVTRPLVFAALATRALL